MTIKLYFQYCSESHFAAIIKSSHAMTYIVLPWRIHSHVDVHYIVKYKTKKSSLIVMGFPFIYIIYILQSNV